MINNLIVTQLKKDKRIIIPELGAFLEKSSDNSVVFIQFLNQDDGVLSNLLAEKFGIELTKAQQIIKDYSNSVKSTLSSRGQFTIEGIGTLRLDSNGAIFLDSKSATTDRFESTENFQSDAPTSIAQEESPESYEPNATTTPASISDRPSEDLGGIFSTSSSKSEEKIHNIDSEKLATNRDQIDNSPHREKKKFDLFLLFAIIAALVAIFSIIYGYLTDNQDMVMPKNNTEQIEQPTENSQK